MSHRFADPKYLYSSQVELPSGMVKQYEAKERSLNGRYKFRIWQLINVNQPSSIHSVNIGYLQYIVY